MGELFSLEGIWLWVKHGRQKRGGGQSSEKGNLSVKKGNTQNGEGGFLHQRGGGGKSEHSSQVAGKRRTRKGEGGKTT